MEKQANRMNYFHVCRECGSGFRGFIKQHTCWKCIGIFLSWYPGKAKNDTVNNTT